MNVPYISDGICPNCKNIYCVITLEERKSRNHLCEKCKQPIMMLFRNLVVAPAPMKCAYCHRDPVYLEKEPGTAIFHFKTNGKIERHLCDLKWELGRVKNEQA